MGLAVYCLMTAVMLIFSAASLRCADQGSLRLGNYILTLKQKRLCLFCSFLPVYLVSALRYRVGGDYIGYERIFNSVLQGKDVYSEEGFSILNRIVAVYSDNIQWVYAICSAIILAAFFYGFFRYSPNPTLSLFLFVSMGYLFSSFNIMRQFIAVTILFAALKLVRENRFFPYLLLVLLAVTFHKTAILMLPMFFLVRLKMKQSYLLMLGIFGLCCFPFRDKLTTLLVRAFYPQYENTALIQPLSAFEFVYYALLFGVVLFLCTKYREKFFKDSYNLILYNCVTYALLLYLCFSFVPEINRIALYLEIFILLLIPRLICCEENPKVRRFYYAVTVTVFSLFFFVTIGIMGRYEVLPYVSVLSL